MLLLSFGIILFVAVIVYVIYIAIQKEKPEEQQPTIHTSGIYSVVHRSPRHNIHPAKPSTDEIKAYLAAVSTDKKGATLGENDKKQLAQDWEAQLEKNIAVIEEGDNCGNEIYCYKPSRKCSYNECFFTGHTFVTREEIHMHPEIIPPLHIGCACMLQPDIKWKTGQNSATQSLPLLRSNFKQADWKTIERD